MILERLLAQVWRVLRTPPARGVPSPRILPAYAALGRAVRDTVEIEPRLCLLVRQLAAELSQCHWCIERGRHAWRQAFLPTPDLGALRHYATTPLFSDRERAALAFTAALCRYTEAAGGMPDAVLAELRRHFAEPEVVALTRLIASEHFFNPQTGALGADAAATPVAAGSAAWPAGGPDRRAAGSAMRNLW